MAHVGQPNGPAFCLKVKLPLIPEGFPKEVFCFVGALLVCFAFGTNCTRGAAQPTPGPQLLAVKVETTLRLRSSPNVNSGVLAHLVPGERVTVIAEGPAATLDKNHGRWLQVAVRHLDAPGFVFGGYLEAASSAGTAPQDIDGTFNYATTDCRLSYSTPESQASLELSNGNAVFAVSYGDGPYSGKLTAIGVYALRKGVVTISWRKSIFISSCFAERSAQFPDCCGGDSDVEWEP